jgi:hypothetical protein
MRQTQEQFREYFWITLEAKVICISSSGKEPKDHPKDHLPPRKDQPELGAGSHSLDPWRKYQFMQ